MSKLDYKEQMNKAEMCEQFITAYLSGNDSPLNIETRDFLTKPQYDQLEVVKRYHEALEIYCSLNKKDEALSLLDSLFTLVDHSLSLFNQTYETGFINFALRLLYFNKRDEQTKELLTIDKLDKFRAGSKQKIFRKLSDAVNAKITEHYFDFWRLDGCFNLLLLLAEGEDKENVYSMQVQTLRLHAQYSLIVGNPANATHCYERASQIAQKIGKTKESQDLLQKASEINLQIHSTPPIQGSIEAYLESILHFDINEIEEYEFLPSRQYFLNEYSSIEDKLTYLLDDKRFILDQTKIDNIISITPKNSLLGWIPSSRDLDGFGNVRGLHTGDEITHLYRISYMEQIIDRVAFLFETWQETNDLTENHIVSLFDKSYIADYDGRIFYLGLKKYFDKDYIISAHLLIPQFENILRTWAEKADISVKKRKRPNNPEWGQKLLEDLLRDNDIEQYFGTPLIQLIRFYLSESNNYRNKIAHGFMTSNQFNHGISAITIWFTLLVAMKPIPKPSS